ncbi:MAG: hypothetical protein IKP00_04800 [Victivallales bacterium]|nr:hypothetical protein [Victivallales bacterium]
MDVVISDGKTILVVKCQGCESECEVSVAIQDGIVHCLGGNNCPTGKSFAIAKARERVKDRN